MSSFATISIRCLAVALLLAAFAPGLSAQSLDARVFDPLTGEPIPLGLTAPPSETVRGGGDELEVRQYLPEGSTKLARAIEPGLVLYQNGATLTLGGLTVTEDAVVPLDQIVLDAQPTDVSGPVVALRKGAGLVTIDVDAFPGSIELVGAAPGRDLLAVQRSGDYAYAGAGTSGIVVYDISDLTLPAEIAVLDTPGSANGMEVDGSTLYVATGTDGLRIYDISTPTAPSEIGAFGTGGAFATYVLEYDDRAYLTGNFGLIVLDVSDPANPTELGRFDTGGETTYEVAFNGDFDTIFYLAGLDGLRRLDVSDPANIIERDFYPGSQVLSVSAIATASEPMGTYTYYAERFQGLHVLEDRSEIAFVENAGFSHKPFFEGDLLYVTDLAGSLRIIDTSGETAAEIARIDVPPNTQEVVVEDGLAYVTDSDFGGTGLTILDVSDPTDPQIIGSYGSGNQVFGLDVVGTTVYLANGFSGLVILDSSDPANLAELGSFPIGSNAVDVEVRDDVAYLVSFGGGMLTLDVSDPANIVQLDAEPDWGFLNAIDFNSAGEITDGIAYVADGQQGLRSVNAADPMDIRPISTSPVSTQARDVAAASYVDFDITGTVVYVADDFYGIREFRGFVGEVEETASFESTDRGIGVAVSAADFGDEDRDIIALAAGETGVYLFTAPFLVANESDANDDAFTLASPFPNPALGTTTLRYTLPESADVTLTVYDVLGRQVAMLVKGPAAVGTHEASFDASSLPSGVYVVRLSSGAHQAAQRLVVVR